MEGFNTQGFSFDLPKGSSSIIKVIGVGGGGNNALKHMYERGIYGVDFVICNTDAQTLDNNPVANKVQLGITMTEGLGAGADPEVGEKAAIESIDEIKAALGQGTKMVFITAGMGGGTGTGAAPVIAKIAKEMGILTVGIVTVPFSFEGKRRLEQADSGLEKLRNNVDSLIVINNDKLRHQFGNLGFKQGFSKADEVLTNAAKGMAEVITGYFDVNIDFRDAKSVLANSGTALMSTGTASGENKAEEAVRKALDSPLLNDNKITGAKNVLLLIRSGNEEATMDEIGLINDHIQREAGNTADIIFGVGTDEELGDAISVLVIATGFAKDNQKHSGPTEKIKISLNDTAMPRTEYRESPFKTREETQSTTETDNFGKINLRLDDEAGNNEPQFFASSPEEETQTQMKIQSQEETAVADFNENEDSKGIDLFSFSDYKPEAESLSFSFEVEDDFRTKSMNQEISMEEEKPIEFNFSIENTTQETAFEIKNIAETEEKTESNEPQSLSFFSDVPKIEEVKEEAPVAEVQNSFVEPVETKQESEFIFTSKKTDESKIQERRNKLKEFNSRYQAVENESDFENVPAFRRKNIAIDGQNPSEQHISSFVSENENGDIQIRENRFLNKDVD